MKGQPTERKKTFSRYSSKEWCDNIKSQKIKHQKNSLINKWAHESKGQFSKEVEGLVNTWRNVKHP
jgi:hypothetical protein